MVSLLSPSGFLGCISRIVVIMFITFVIMRIVFHKNQPPNASQNALTTLTSVYQSPPSHQGREDLHDKLKQNLRVTELPTSQSRSHLNISLYQEKKKKKRLEKDQNLATLGLSSTRYSEKENSLYPVALTWEQFISLPSQPSRHTLTIPNGIIKRLKVCTDKLNRSADIETEQQGVINLSSTSTKNGCNSIWNDQFLAIWKSRKVKGLCEDTANSKISCFDSVGKSRYCIFENAMMNFRKVRKRKLQDSYVRSWERGFLSADCGDMAPDDIGYIPLYKPDIEGRDEAICDYVFNETVIAYSHDNIRNYHYMISDYLNVFAMLWLSGYNKYMNDVSFLNIDGLNSRKGKYNGDQVNQFFKPYNVSFRRIIKAHDIAESGSKICFKKLIMQPRPELQFQLDGHDDQSCPSSPSSLYQRFNLQIRHHLHMLPLPHQHSLEIEDEVEVMNVLLILRSLRPGQLVKVPGVLSSVTGSSSNNIFDYAIARLFKNEKDIATSLEEYLQKKESKFSASTDAGRMIKKPIRMNLRVADLASLQFDEQIKLVSESSVIIGMYGAGIATSIHMSLGTMRYCCGILEIFPPNPVGLNYNNNINRHGNKGYGVMSRRLGFFHERLDIISTNESITDFRNESTSGAIELGTAVPIEQLLKVLDKLIDDIIQAEGSCFLPEVIQNPYL